MPRGRTRDEDARRRVLDAALSLVGTSTEPATINDIAAAAGVAKQTIYRWWPTRTAVILDALVGATMKATPFPTTADIRSDFESHLRSVIRLFNSPTGSVIREIVGQFQSDAVAQEEFRQRFWEPRRALSRTQLARGVDAGLIRADVDTEVVLDAIYGPLWSSLLIGHRALRISDAARIIEVVWAGVAAPATTQPAD